MAATVVLSIFSVTSTQYNIHSFVEMLLAECRAHTIDEYILEIQ